MSDLSARSPRDEARSRAVGEQPWRRTKPVILVAEDDPSDRELLRRALQQLPEHCDVRMVSDGVELLEYLKSGCSPTEERKNPAPDLMIVDLKMPRKGGREALLAINDELGIETPVVIFSGSDDAADISACYRAGCNSYVMKPIDLHHFNEAVQTIAAYWLRLSKLPQQAW
jgi:CheY-like chemotaxis protein